MTDHSLIEQLEAAIKESDEEIAHLHRQLAYLEARLALEKKGYKCSCKKSRLRLVS